MLRTTNVPDDQARPVLHIRNLDTGQDVTVANATGGTFSADSNWIAYQIDPSPGRGRSARGGAANAPSTTPTPSPNETPGTPPPAPTTPPPTDPAVPPGAPAPPATTTTPAPATATTAPQTPAAQQTGRGANADAPPPPRRVELRHLADGTVQSFQDIGAFMFAPDSSLLVLKRRPAVPAETGNSKLKTQNSKLRIEAGKFGFNF